MEGKDDEESLLFLDTQMQSAYERLEVLENTKKLTLNSLSQLASFRHKDMADVKNPLKLAIARAPKALSRVSKSKAKRVPKTLNAQVQRVYGKIEIPKKDQQMILPYLSGKHQKLKALLFQNSQSQSKSRGRRLERKVPYTPEEWEEVMELIKDKLPKLSDVTKRTLGDISNRIEKQQSQSTFLLWEKASHHPSTDLSPDDIKILYDLTSSQAMEEEIPDSSSEPELLDFHNITTKESSIDVLKSVNSLQFKSIPSDDEVVVSSSVTSSPVRAPTTPRKSYQDFKISPIKLTPPQFSNTYDSDSVYATARSQQNEKRYRTRILEVDGDIEVKEIDSDKIKIRKIGQRPFNDNMVEVIEDSDSEAKDISIIELSTLVDDDEPNTSDLIANLSVIQVPSSPDLNPGPALSQASQVSEIISSKPSQKEKYNQRTARIVQDTLESDKVWRDRINVYEPISLIELQAWLESQDVEVDSKFLRSFCDEYGIITKTDK